MEKTNSNEEVSVKTGKRGRPRKTELKKSNKSGKKQTKYKYVHTEYAGIYKMEKYVDGKKVKLDPQKYKVDIELGIETVVDKKGNVKKKRKKTSYIVNSKEEAKRLKATQYTEKKVVKKNVTVEQAWNDFFEYIEMRDGNDLRAEATIYEYKLHRKYFECYFGLNKKIKDIDTLEMDEFFNNCYKGNAYTGKTLGHHTCEKLKSTYTQLYKYMSKAPERYGIDINVIKNASISKNESDREKNFKAVSLTVDEINLLIKCAVEECETRDAGNLIILALCCLSGMRKGEMAGLKWGDLSEIKPGGKIYIHNNRISVNSKTVEKGTKTNKNRYSADLCNATYLMLRIAKHVMEDKFGVEVKSTDYVYNTAAGLMRDDRAPNPGAIWRRYEEFCRRARRKLYDEENIEYGEYRYDEESMFEKISYHRVHDLRHSFASLLMAGNKKENIGIPFYEISFSMGHSLKGNMTVSTYLQDNYNRDNIRKYWDSVIDLKPMKEYMKRHGMKIKL